MSDDMESSALFGDSESPQQRLSAVSFSLSHRLYRAIWGVVWTLFASWTPAPLHIWRAQLLRLFGADLDRNVRVYGSAKIWYPKNLVMAQNAVIGPGVVCYSMARITIGVGAIVSQRAHLCAGTHDVDDPNFQLQAYPIVIGNNAWIAAEAFVGPGVQVGEGAVLGARGVMVKNMEPWTIYAGNPARALRKRRGFR